MMIVHRCSCGHPDTFHNVTRQECSYGMCTSPVHDYGPPEPVPSWQPDGGLNPGVIPPGSRIRGYPPLCECDDCRALYAELAGEGSR